MPAKCRFCEIIHEQSEPLHETAHFVILTEPKPVSPGHMLIVSKRCTKNDVDFSPEEQEDFWRALTLTRRLIKETYNPDGFNVGFNDGKAAGQTQMHFHAHVIPRYKGDVENPIGGVRNLLGNNIPPKRS